MLPKQITDELFKLLKVEKADPQKQQELLASIEEFSSELTLNFAIENLNKADFETFSQLLDEDATGAKALEFAKGKVVDFEKKLANVIKGELIRLSN